jgi:hypothetical protein
VVDVQKRWLLVLSVLLASSACVIGPKQDDPASGASTSEDTGVSSSDTGTGAFDDATVTPADDAGGGADTLTSDDAPSLDSAASDTGSSVDGADGSFDGSSDGEASVDASDEVSVDASVDASTDALVEGG